MQNKKSGNTKTLHKAIIYEGYGAVPGKTKFVRESSSGRLTIIAIGNPSESLSVAIELVNDGVELIELCGYIPLIWKVKIIKAVGKRAKVSSVTFGIESLQLAAEFSRFYEKGTPPREAYIILKDGSNASTDRFEKIFDFQHTTFIPVPNETTAVEVASELASSGYGLIELYGGFCTIWVSKVIEAVAGRIAVGVGSFTLEETNSQIY